MTDIDERIRQALSAEDRALMETMGDEQGIFTLIGRSFQGKMKAFIVVAWIAMFGMFAFAVLSLIQLLSTTDISAKIQWGVALIVSTQFLGGTKMWYFLELNKLAAARDIRRLELRIMGHGQ